MNRYAYTTNDPVNFIDPTGLFKITVGVTGKASAGVGGKAGVQISYDTNGHTLSVKGLVGPRGGVSGQIKITADISESGTFAKSDVKFTGTANAEASVGFAKAESEGSVELSLRDGFSGDTNVNTALGGEAILEGGSIVGGTLDAAFGADAGITGAVELSLSGTEVVNAVKSGSDNIGEMLADVERGFRDQYRGSY